MRTLVGTRWQDGFLDEALRPTGVRIRVGLWLLVAPVEDAFFIRERDWRVLFNYLRHIGVIGVLRKVRSRLQESARNDRWVAVGYGEVMEKGLASSVLEGSMVAFIAPFHPRCVERIVLEDALVKTVEAPISTLPDSVVLGQAGDMRDATRGIAGWHPESGVRIDNESLSRLLELAEDACRSAAEQAGERYMSGTPVAEATTSGRRLTGRKEAVLFGYGNYAKTIILPSVKDRIDIVRVHEMDALQIGPRAFRSDKDWDTAPLPRDGESHEVIFIASFHHTHAPIALYGLREGASVVVEKPIATTHQQLDALIEALQDSGSLYSCFHKRYSRLNGFARTDLGLESGEPVSYHCIVYEEPLPAKHWYRWPNSRGRIVSNGCHWIDHFLWLNDFPHVVRSTCLAGKSDEIVIGLEAENGAAFSMALTSRGSRRLGVQDHVELRVRDRTARIENDTFYVAEDDRKVLRRKKVGRLSSYRDMYSSIARQITEGSPGDSISSIERSTRLILNLEDLVAEVSGAVLAEAEIRP